MVFSLRFFLEPRRLRVDKPLLWKFWTQGERASGVQQKMGDYPLWHRKPRLAVLGEVA